MHPRSSICNLFITAPFWVGQHYIWLFFLPKFVKVLHGRGSNLYLRKHQCLLKRGTSSDCQQCQFITTVNYIAFEQCSVTRLAQMPLRFLLLIAMVCRHPWDLCPTARHPLWQAPLCFSVPCPAEGTDNQAPDLQCSHPLSSTCFQELCTGLWIGKWRGQSTGATPAQPASGSSLSYRFGLFHPSIPGVLQTDEQALVLYRWHMDMSP